MRSEVPEEPKGKIRFVDHDEEERLLAVCSEPLRTVVLMGIHAGVRVQSEALILRWGNIDLARRQLTVEGAYAKNSETRSIPINTDLHAALSRLRKVSANTGPTDPVFVNRLGEPLRAIRTAFATACRRAGLGRDVVPHTLRHSFASRLVMAGVDLRTVQELGGWKELDMVVRYAHLSPSHKADAVERIMDKKPGSNSLRYSLQQDRASS